MNAREQWAAALRSPGGGRHRKPPARRPTLYRTTDYLELILAGPVIGRAEPEWGPRGMHPAERTKEGMNLWREVWLSARRPCLGPDVPFGIRIIVSRRRPLAHFRRDGSLTPLGRRTPLPTAAPDLDNVAKIVFDALKGYAWADDAYCVDLHVIRRWAATDWTRVEATRHPLAGDTP